jgi:hypothetical protein
MESGGYGLAAGRAGPAENGPAGVVERRLSRKRHRVQLSHTRLRASPAGALLRRGTGSRSTGAALRNVPPGHRRGARSPDMGDDAPGTNRICGPSSSSAIWLSLPRLRSAPTQRTAELVSALTRRKPRRVERAILKRADATELYAEDLVRLAAGRGVDAGFPGSIQALIAAGLHTLSHKELSSDVHELDGRRGGIRLLACARARRGLPPSRPTHQATFFRTKSVARRARWLRAEVLHGCEQAAGPGYLYEIYSKRWQRC